MTPRAPRGSLTGLIYDHRTSCRSRSQDKKNADNAFTFDNVFAFNNADDVFTFDDANDALVFGIDHAFM